MSSPIAQGCRAQRRCSCRSRRRRLAGAGRDVRTLRVFGRLTADADLADAAADLDAIAADLRRRFPATNDGTRLRLEPLNQRLLGGAAARRGWRPFIAAGLMVIAVAATNAGNLLLVGAAARAREVALRTSLGASRGRILRQLLVESVILAGLAAILGLVLSRAGVGLYRQRIPDGILPYWFDYSLNGALFAGLSVMTLATVAVFAVLACAPRVEDRRRRGAPGRRAMRHRATGAAARRRGCWRSTRTGYGAGGARPVSRRSPAKSRCPLMRACTMRAC